MQPRPRPDEIRKSVARVFRELGAGLGDLADLDETILIDAGKCAARSYRAGSLMAMWLIEVAIVQFYDAEGNMLRTLSLPDELARQRKAA